MITRPSTPEVLTTRELLGEIRSNASLLVKRQLELTRLEARLQSQREKTFFEIVGAAGLFAYAGVIVLLVALALAIGQALDGRYWLGALVVGGALIVLAAILAPVGWSRRVTRPL